MEDEVAALVRIADLRAATDILSIVYVGYRQWFRHVQGGLYVFLDPCTRF